MDNETAIQHLRMTAINRLVGYEVGSDQLIQLGLDALLAGVEAPSLPVLAGLSRAEEPEASELFDRVVRELRLMPADLPPGETARSWALVRWWARLLIDGTLSVHTGGELIYWHGHRLQPEPDAQAFQALCVSTVIYDDTLTSWAVWDPDYQTRCRDAEADVIRKAQQFLAEPTGPQDAAGN